MNIKETAILYTGKEKGSAKGKLRIQYFKYLKAIIKSAKFRAEDIIKTKPKTDFTFIYKSKIIVEVKYFNTYCIDNNKPHFYFYFIEYLEKFSPDTLSLLKNKCN